MAILAGLTGTIGSGKTLAASYFKELGAHIIDADALARELVCPGQPALAEIVEAFGAGVLSPDGSLDREKMAAIVFSDPAQKKTLESILHPRIIAREMEAYQAIRRLDPCAVVIVDAAVLIESGNYRNMDKVIVVAAGEEARAERAARRGGLSREEIEAREATQYCLEEKLKYADFVLDNRGDEAALKKNVGVLHARLRELAVVSPQPGV